MVATTVLISQILLAGAALAAPSAGGLAGRIARRREASHLSRPLQLARSSTNAQNNANTTHAEESNNWSGAVLVANSAVCSMPHRPIMVLELISPSFFG